MDRRESFESLELALKALAQGTAAQLWTSSPGIVEAVHLDAAGALTVDVQLAIRPRIFDPIAGAWKDADPVPLCVDVPVKFFGNSKFLVTLPLAKGDEGILIFAKNCIDGWWQSGGIQSQLEIRSHDLSDAFFLPGIYSKPNVPANISTAAMQMRNFAGDTYVEVKNGQLVNIVAPGGVNINGVTIDTHGSIAGVKDFTNTGNTSLSGGAQALKRADGTNTTKVTGT